MQATKKRPVLILAECAVMLALAFALSFIGPEAPMGGRITPASMLPLFFIAIHLGIAAAAMTSTLYAALQVFQALIAGNVFVWVQSDAFLVVLCVLFDYVLPFTLPFLLVALVRKMTKSRFVLTCAIVGGMAVRFLCHYVSGVAIWGQWAEDMSPYLYSLLYNGGYMLPEAIITAALALLLLQSKQLRHELLL